MMRCDCLSSQAPVAASLAAAAAFATALLFPLCIASAQDNPWPDAKRSTHERPAQKRKAEPATPTSTSKVQVLEKAGAKVSRRARPLSAEAAPTMRASYRDALSRHGTWVEDPNHGAVWLPDPATVGKDFAPYREAGHWAVTDKDAWAWVSDYKWGAIPFHYGSWDWNVSRGWAWVPGEQWAPAWVVWRLGKPGFDYVGWAPMTPSPKRADGPSSARAGARALPFWFVSSTYLFDPHVSNYIVRDRKLGKVIYKGTRIFAGHTARANRDDVSGGPAPLRAASPSFEAAQIPSAVVPKTRLRLEVAKSESASRNPRDESSSTPAVHEHSPSDAGAVSSGVNPSCASCSLVARRKLRLQGGRHALRARRATRERMARDATYRLGRPLPPRRCRRWVRTWSGALRCAHR